MGPNEAMTVPGRLAAVCVAIIATWLGLGATSTAAVASATAQVASYTYDGLDHTDASASSSTKRAPPASSHTSCPHAVGALSHGASARTDRPTLSEASTYDDPTALARDASVTAATGGHVGVPRADLSSPERTGVAANSGSKLAQGARYLLSLKIQGQLANRGWTTEAIDEAVQSGQQVRAVNKATGNPATRYIHPSTGQSVVIDDVTGEVIHVGGPGFKYGPGSGDVQ